LRPFIVIGLVMSGAFLFSLIERAEVLIGQAEQ
jgi:hypothetical protein